MNNTKRSRRGSGRRESSSRRRVATVHRGDSVVLRSGEKVATAESPGETTLRGVACVVVDEPVHRKGSCDGKVQERVHVRPVLPTGGLGMPLDVPTHRIRPEDRRRSRAVGGFGNGTGGVRELRERLGLNDD